MSTLFFPRGTSAPWDLVFARRRPAFLSLFSIPLVTSERQGIEIDCCPQCRGVWLDRGELDTILERAARDMAPGAPGAPCPRRPPTRPKVATTRATTRATTATATGRTISARRRGWRRFSTRGRASHADRQFPEIILRLLGHRRSPRAEIVNDIIQLAKAVAPSVSPSGDRPRRAYTSSGVHARRLQG